ncbi:uncharacterized protein LOC111471903 isoform X3 [Cucurbita maxima]|uniref:PRA1 family protein n=1 Tax=Cucurbita maxima TaxID=3661 RepID=A0A6J1IB61_CUCMA|nr:uncharacterized protein LOC111471903 isoform X3 [Cucurbita maxima]
MASYLYLWRKRTILWDMIDPYRPPKSFAPLVTVQYILALPLPINSTRTVDDRLVMVVLTLITVALLFFTHATKNIIISMSIGVVVVFVHGALKGSEDIFSLDEEGLSECAGGRGVIKMPLKHAASASFSLS